MEKDESSPRTKGTLVVRNTLPEILVDLNCNDELWCEQDEHQA